MITLMEGLEFHAHFESFVKISKAAAKKLNERSINTYASVTINWYEEPLKQTTMAIQTLAAKK